MVSLRGQFTGMSIFVHHASSRNLLAEPESSCPTVWTWLVLSCVVVLLTSCKGIVKQDKLS